MAIISSHLHLLLRGTSCVGWLFQPCPLFKYFEHTHCIHCRVWDPTSAEHLPTCDAKWPLYWRVITVLCGSKIKHLLLVKNVLSYTYIIIPHQTFHWKFHPSNSQEPSIWKVASQHCLCPVWSSHRCRCPRLDQNLLLSHYLYYQAWDIHILL